MSSEGSKARNADWMANLARPDDGLKMETGKLALLGHICDWTEAVE